MGRFLISARRSDFVSHAVRALGTPASSAVSDGVMRIRWRFILPILGLILFAFVSYGSFKTNRARGPTKSRYFWWDAMRLDSDPLNKRHLPASACAETRDSTDVCLDWDQADRSLRWQARLFWLSALPTFISGLTIVFFLGQLGISQVSSFMVSMPLLLAAWYYFVGWRIDRRKKPSA